jgi:transposase
VDAPPDAAPQAGEAAAPDVVPARPKRKAKKKKTKKRRPAKPRPVGRPRQVLDETVRAAFMSAIELNATLADASAFAGMSVTTACKYQALGLEALEKPEKDRTKDEREFALFAEGIKVGRARFKLRNLQNIQKAAGEGTWTASAWLLERSFPDEFARREPKAVSEKPTAVTVQVIYPDGTKLPEVVKEAA